MSLLRNTKIIKLIKIDLLPDNNIAVIEEANEIK